MKSIYTLDDAAKAIDALLQLVDKDKLDGLFEEHPIIHEVWSYGKDGIMTLGVGIYGGHAIE